MSSVGMRVEGKDSSYRRVSKGCGINAARHTVQDAQSQDRPRKRNMRRFKVLIDLVTS